MGRRWREGGREGLQSSQVLGVKEVLTREEQRAGCHSTALLTVASRSWLGDCSPQTGDPWRPRSVQSPQQGSDLVSGRSVHHRPGELPGGSDVRVHERDSAALNSTRRLQARPDRAAVAGEAVNFNYLSMCGLAL